ncbi:hypothetical protein J5N97_025903 [Dioscorea zingiberensis]|uniref:Uncharacterized protein n=1 Tax=Dioscorea zingiberensis TaxID=325984 RepID=A0A9D5C1L9_9LILI|nr:hypothetical protein J5N97_025903 [Dioscorea zingiberensis]
MGVLIQTTALVYVFPSSLGSGASARVGNELGANRPGRAKSAAGVAVALAGLLGFIAMGFAAGVRQRWGRMFTQDGEIVRLTAAALPIVGLCEVGNCPQTVGCGVLRGSARPAHAARINLGAFYLVGMPVAGFMIYIVGTTDWEAQARRAQLLTYGASSELLDQKHDQLEVMEEGKGSFVSDNKESDQEISFQPLIANKILEIER